MKRHDEERHDFEIGVFWTGSLHYQVRRQEAAESVQHSKLYPRFRYQACCLREIANRCHKNEYDC